MKHLVTNQELQQMIKAVNSNDSLKQAILSHFEARDKSAIIDVLRDGYYERFDRYDSAVCEEFITAWEKEYK